MDVCAPNAFVSPLPGYLKELRAKGEISEEVFEKVAYKNAQRLAGV